MRADNRRYPERSGGVYGECGKKAGFFGKPRNDGVLTPAPAFKVVLAGNPNAGKTTLFNALTKSNLRTGNFHGVTTSPAHKTVKGISFADVPGMYAFKPYSMEEKSAIEEVKSADVVINVVDALTLENSLNLTRQIIASNKRTIVYITKYDSLLKRGGSIDFEKLSRHLGAPVYNCTPKQLLSEIECGNAADILRDETISLNDAYNGGNLKVSRADRLFYNRFFALFFFVVSVITMFFLAFHPSMAGAYLKGCVETLVCDILCSAITDNMSNPALISLVEEGIFGGAGTVLSFIPQILILYLFLTLLDESGITSALAFATDGIFEKVNLSGRAAFSLVSGFGCTAAAILTTRGYSTPEAQKRTVAVLPFIPCGAKLPVFLTFLSPLFKNPFPVITLFYFAGLIAALLISKFIKGGKEGLLTEVTPICVPRIKAVVIKLCFYLKGFIIKVAGIVMLFCVISWLLSHFSFTFEYVGVDESMLAAISKLLLPFFYPMGITDWRIAYAALCGLIAKENVAATISMLLPLGTGLTLSSTLAMCAFVLLCPACISALSASVKETGVKYTAKCVAFQLVLSFSVAYLIRLIFIWI